MGRRPRGAARLVAGGLAAAALTGLVVAGCDRDSGSADPTTSSSSSTPTTVDEEAAVIEAYLAELDAFYAAANPPDPDHRALEETATGAFLETLQSNLADLRSRGLAIRRGEATSSDPSVVSVRGGTATVHDCAVDADIQFRVDSGEMVNDEVTVGLFVATLQRVDGVWKVAENRFREGACDPS